MQKGSVAFTINDLVPSKDMIDLCKVGRPAAIALAIGSVMSFGMNQILKNEKIALAIFTTFYKLWCFVIMQVNVQGMIPVI